jgi:hypothetical protein
MPPGGRDPRFAAEMQRSESGVMVASASWGATSVMRAAASKSPLGWPARMARILGDSRPDQMLRRKSSDTSGARLLRCLRNWDGLWSAISSSIRSWRMRCSWRGQQPHQLSPQRGVGVSFQQRGDDVLYSRGVPVVQLLDHIAELGLLAADASQGKLCLAWANYTVGRSAQSGESHTATLGTSAGGELSAASILCGGHRCGMSVPVARRDNHVNFYNIYCCQKSIQTSRQAECAVTSEVLWALKRVVFLRQGTPNKCRRNSSRSGLARQSSLHRQPGDCEAASLLCVAGWATTSWLFFLASAVG